MEKVLNVLQKKQINYIVIAKDDNDIKIILKKRFILNKYQETLTLAKKYFINVTRIEDISNKLLNKVFESELIL